MKNVSDINHANYSAKQYNDIAVPNYFSQVFVRDNVLVLLFWASLNRKQILVIKNDALY